MTNPRFQVSGRGGAATLPHTRRLSQGAAIPNVAPRFGPPTREEFMRQQEDNLFTEQASARFANIAENYRLKTRSNDKFIQSLPLSRPTDQTQRDLEDHIVLGAQQPRFKNTTISQKKKSLGEVAIDSLKTAVDDSIVRNVKNLTSGALGTAGSFASFAEMVGFDNKATKATKAKIDEWRVALEPEDHDFVDMLGQGAGSALTFFIPGAGVMQGSSTLARVSPTAARWFGAGASALLEASAESGGVYEEGLQMGMTEDEAKMAATKTFAVNAVLVGLTNRFSIFGDQKKAVRRALNSMTSEGLQEFFQQVTSNISLGKQWDEGAYQSAAIGLILGPILSAGVPSSNSEVSPTTQGAIAEATNPKNIQENIGIVIDSMEQEGLITPKRASELRESRELNLKQGKAREGIEAPKSPEPRLQGEKKPEIETQPRLAKRGVESEPRLPGAKGDQNIEPGESRLPSDQNADGVPPSRFSPQNQAEQGSDAVDQSGPAFPQREDAKAVSTTRAQGRNIDGQPEIRTDHTDRRNLRREVRDRIRQQNEKISDDQIKQTRLDNLLGDESIDEIIARKRGIRTNADIENAARELKVNEEMLLNLEPGTALNAEQSAAVDQTVQYHREVNKDLQGLKMRMEKDGGEGFSREERNAVVRSLDDVNTAEKLSDEDLMALALFEQTRKLRKLEMVQFALKSETGRALQIAKKQMSSVDLRLRSIYTQIKNLPSLQRQAVIDELAKVDIQDPKQYVEFLNSVAKPDIFDKIAEWTVAVKLWNPTTQVVNMGSNAVRQATDVGVTGIEAVATGDPQLFFMDMQGAAHGTKVGIQNMVRALTDEGYMQQLSKYLETGGSAPAIQGLKGKIIRLPFRFLTAGDELFKGIAYSRAVYRYAWQEAGTMHPVVEMQEGEARVETRRQMAEKLINGRNLQQDEFKIYERIHKKALSEAKRMTFQEDMGEVTRKINSLRSPSSFKSLPGKVSATVLRSQVSFLKTPVNIFMQSVRDFNPVGLIGHLNNKSNTQSDKIRRASEAAIGLSLFAYLINLARRGLATGAPPDDEKEREKFYNVEKKLPYAIRVGDQWVQYKRAEPFAIIMGMAADVYNLDDDDPSILQRAGHVWHVISRQMEDKTYLAGIGNLVDLTSPEEWRRNRAIADMILSNIFPSIVPHVARSTDSEVKESKNLSLIESIRSRIPGLSKDVTPSVDVFGNTVERANKGLNYFFNPIQSQSALVTDPVAKELIALDYMFPLPPAKIRFADLDIELNRKEYERYSRDIGLTLHAASELMVQRPDYLALNRVKRIKELEKLRSQIVDIASQLMGAEVTADRPLDVTELIDNYLEQQTATVPPASNTQSIPLNQSTPPPRFSR